MSRKSFFLEKRKDILIAALIVISFSFGYFLGSRGIPQSIFNFSNQESDQTLEELDACVDIEPMEQREVFSLLGRIISINSNVLEVELDSGINEVEYSRAKALVTDSTKIFVLVKKTEEVIAQERALANANNLPLSSAYKDVLVNLSNLKVGDNVFIEANENIREKEEFEAGKIEKQIHLE